MKTLQLLGITMTNPPPSPNPGSVAAIVYSSVSDPPAENMATPLASKTVNPRTATEIRAPVSVWAVHRLSVYNFF